MIIHWYVADKKVNGFMRAADLCPPYKVFADKVEHSLEQPKHLSNEQIAMLIINRSKSWDEFWIPAVIIEDVFYSDDAIKEISDGNKITFIP